MDSRVGTTFGKYNVTEGFFETIVPLARNTGFAESQLPDYRDAHVTNLMH